MKRLIGASRTDDISVREKENADVAYKAALESMVLLRNTGALPLRHKEVALFGNGASHTIKGGSGSGEVNNRHSVTILEGLQNAGLKISSMAWIEEYDSYVEAEHDKWRKANTGIPKGMALSTVFNAPNGRMLEARDIRESNREVAIYVVSKRAGEAYDRKIQDNDFNLTKAELHDIEFLYKEFKELIVIINSGCVLDLSELDDTNISLVFYGMAGQEGGRALADLLTGKENFSGKLTDTWVKKYKDIPYGDEYGVTAVDSRNEYYREGIYVGYRYFDTFQVEPRFYFGQGLSYTSFNMSIDKATISQSKVHIVAEVKNTGCCNGKEVVQVYVSCPQGALDKEYKRLVAFNKSDIIEPNKSEVIEISFDMYACASFDEEKASYILEKGDYIVRMGNASNNTKPIFIIEVDEDIVLSIHEHIFEGRTKFDELEAPKLLTEENLDGIERLQVNASDFSTITYTYDKPSICLDDDSKAVLEQLSDEELIDVVVGTGMSSMFDSEFFYNPGSCGRTTKKYVKKGLLPSALADGPAGLRLLQKSALRKNGHIKLYKGHYFVSFMEILPSYVMALVNASKKDMPYYQYATAFPAGINMASTWNTNLMEEAGYAISREMDEFNITYWLGPGMNIHKNPLCGRNFEYYSEDPLLTGKISAAITRGVQKIKGNYTTIKHFCCNNITEDSNLSNSHVSERALREIYLKGFEINICEAHSKAVMTSYNKVNGIYAADSYDLCTKILKNEWGFDGVAMSDWDAVNEGFAHADIAIAVGNDLIMPGNKNNKKTIKVALKNGTLSSEDLRRAAANIIKNTVQSNSAVKYYNCNIGKIPK